MPRRSPNLRCTSTSYIHFATHLMPRACLKTVILRSEATKNLPIITVADHLHPWFIGQPFRIRYLDQAIGYIMGQEGVWAATGSEIVEWYRSNPPESR